MTRKKIYIGLRKEKKVKTPEISIKMAAFSQLNISRETKKSDDELKIAELVDASKLDTEKRYNKKYMEGIAKELGWKVGRLEKGIERMVQRMKIIESLMKHNQPPTEEVKKTEESKNE